MILESSMFKLDPSPNDLRDYRLPVCSFTTHGADFIIGDNREIHTVNNQRQSSMCSAFALAGILEFFNSGDDRLSPAFIYGNREDDDRAYEGEYLRKALQDVRRDGACLFSEFPMIGSIESCMAGFKTLNVATIKKARERRISEYYRVSVSEIGSTMQTYNVPILLGIGIYKSMAKAFKNGGIIPAIEVDEELVGGHAVRAIGVKTINDKQYYVIANSWGKYLDDEGYQYLPMDYNIFEAWLLRPYKDLKIVMEIDSDVATINGEKIQLDVRPEIRNGRTYVPLRFVMEMISGFKVAWNDKTNTAIATYRGERLYFKKDDVGFSSDTKMRLIPYEDDLGRTGLTTNKIVRNRMLVPIRKVFEYCGWNVLWNTTTREVIITNGGKDE